MKIRRLLLPIALAGTCLLSLGACALSLASLFVLMSKHSGPAGAPPLRWSQIESSDSARYAENLRAIGCPAPTIQAIVGQTESENSPSNPSASTQADASPTPAAPAAVSIDPALAAAPAAQPQTFAERRAAAIAAQAQRQAEAQSYAAATNPAPVYTEAAQPAPVSTSFSNTESSTETDTSSAGYSGTSAPTAYAQGGASGSSSSTGYAAAGTAPAAPVQTIVAPDANSQIPAAFMDAPPSTHLNEAQAHQLDQIQQQFANTVSSSTPQNSNPSQDPSSPSGSSPATQPGQPAPQSTAAKTWQSATSLSDQQFRTQFGDQAFLARQYQSNLHKTSN